ncbi:membrane protein [Hymenobacter cavernae]|uniref:Membrane protein n=2 Tax=Hymenobacter cavernae TaxID=2044852 RepID=A0ABQ1TUG7_9BACT|nr:membrane protein [Hymenobacter cavernae]
MAQYAQVGLQAGLSGRQIAELMLADHGITDVRVISTEGRLTDHYNPADKTVNLSEAVYEERSAAAAAIAAHECGHAVQHATAYSMLQFRSAMVPALSAVSRFMPFVLMAGVLMIRTTVLPLGIGIALFALTTLFSFVTLPVEFDASRRALAWIDRRGIVTTQEHAMAKDALWWAAMTYVVAALSSLATLLYYVSIFMGGRDRR